MSRFGGDPDVVGTTVAVEGASYRNVERQTATIVGVLPERDWFRANVDIWMPFRLVEAEESDRGARTYWLFGRLAAGVDHASAEAELETHLTHLVREHPSDNRGLTVELEDARTWLYGDEQGTVSLLLAAAALLLLIACGNVAHLLFARVSDRRRELAMRCALGAGRLRILQFLAWETALVALGGGIVGVAFASLGVQLAAASVATAR